jgi:ACT domain-containing protein
MSVIEIAKALLIDGCVTVSGAVKEFGISRSRLYELMGDQRLPYSDANGRRLIPRASLRLLIAEGMKGVPEAVAVK